MCLYCANTGIYFFFGWSTLLYTIEDILSFNKQGIVKLGDCNDQMTISSPLQALDEIISGPPQSSEDG